ncbi:MAG: Fe-S protein assembly co-chaperone HscB [Acidobacteria bacterium]|nr:Fe-S protein assembly co-chaperone HscB [Acidobacteriota bacterium]MBV9145915.1 Fe-S protein assembly co-chaperone HscB [Acidobacteriota bacterium]MBV9436575.1 Fe-S protein assembly co-chaperone HscB [Acidobacteriota bacterium]
MHPVVPNPETLSAVTCWSCLKEIDKAAHFCAHCTKLQPPADSDYFSFFGLQRRLNIDLKSLEQEFYRLSRKLHPDVYARATEHEQQWSTQKSSLLNDAYRTLRDPIARTEYLLELEGVKLEEQSRSATDEARAQGKEKQQVVPPDLLEEVFELNMQLEEMRMSKKLGERDEQVAKDLEAAKVRFEQTLAGSNTDLQKLWQEWDQVIAGGADAADPQRIAVRDKMVALLNRRSYVRNLVRDVNEALTADV